MTHRVINQCLSFICVLCALAQPASAQQPAWAVNPADYQFSMNVVAQLQVGGQPNHAPGNVIAGFHGGAVRGKASALLSGGGQAYYFLTLYSNAYAGDSLTFRAFVSVGGQLYESSDTVVFKHQQVLGSLGSPFPLHFAPSERPFIFSPSNVGFTELTCPDTLHDVQASDNQSSEGNGLTFSITGGADAPKFSIDGQWGLLSWLNIVPDFENPSDADGNNTYEVEVSVTDASGYTDAQLVVVTVSDNLPVAAHCPENKAAGTNEDGAGNCSSTASGTGLLASSDACASSYGFVLSGATSGSGAGDVPVSQLFNSGSTTVTYTVTVGEAGGGSAECSFTVTVTDNEIPVLTCPANATRTPGGAGCVYTTDGSEFDATAVDNCGVIIDNSNSLNNGPGLSGYVFQSNSVTTIVWHATDAAGHTGNCSFTVTVGGCNISLSGTIRWQTDPNQGVNNTVVTLTGSAAGSMTTGPSGTYTFATNVTTGSFTLTPAKNINKLNGLTAADATAIQQHVANAVLLTNPYKIVAADVNHSNTVTSLDASLINQALLGNQSALAQIKSSWRFAPAAYVMNNPPWGFPEKIVLTNVSGNQTGKDFYGFKTGDVVTPTANPANLSGGGGNGLTWRVKDQTLEAGSEIEVFFGADEVEDLAACQFALRFDPATLQLLEIAPAAGSPFTAEHFGTYEVSEGAIRVVWSQASGLWLEAGAPVFALRFIALEGGTQLSEALELDGSLLPALAYNSGLQESKVALKFSDATGTGAPADGSGWQLFQNRPNPFSGVTTLAFSFSRETEAELRVSDARGRVLLKEKKRYAAGRHEELLRLEGISGILYAELVTEWGSVARKMVAISNR